MKLLIDTHIFLWFINDSPHLSQNAVDLLESDTDILLSIASLWEIAIKVNLKKLTLPDVYEKFIPEQIAKNTIQMMPVTIAHLNIVAKGASQFCLKGKFTHLAPPSLVGKGAGGLGLFAFLRCSRRETPVTSPGSI